MFRSLIVQPTARRALFPPNLQRSLSLKRAMHLGPEPATARLSSNNALPPQLLRRWYALLFVTQRLTSRSTGLHTKLEREGSSRAWASAVTITMWLEARLTPFAASMVARVGRQIVRAPIKARAANSPPDFLVHVLSCRSRRWGC